MLASLSEPNEQENFHVLLQHGMRRYGDADNVQWTSFKLAITKVMMIEVLGTLVHQPCSMALSTFSG